MAEAASGDVLMPQALALHQQGRLQEAEPLYAAVARQQPDNADVRHLLGIIALQTGRPDRAVDLIGEAIALNAGIAAAYNNRAIALRRLGRLDEALDSLDRAIVLEPDNAEAHNNRGSVLRDAGLLDAALPAFDRAVALRPDYADAHINRGLLLRSMGQSAAALQSYDRALALRPNHAGLHYNRGNALLDLTRREEALASFDQAISLQPSHVQAHAARGNALLQLGRTEQALASYDQAIALRPDYAEAYGDRGNMLQLLDRFDEALASYDQAIALKPRDAGPYFSRGELLRFQGRADEAVASLDAAVEMDPLHASARLAACMAELPILYASDAEIPVRRQRYLAALERLEAAADDPAVRRSLAEQIGAPPFYLPYQGENDVVPQAIYGKLACRILGETFPPARPPPRPSAGERIRLGIPSGYFRDHTIYKLFLEGWLTEIDRSRFEVIGFHTSALSDHVTTRLAGLCDHFVQGLPSNAAWREAIVDAAPHALLYAEVGIDPVIGWLAAQRLAPLQCLTWGHPETTGMPTLDYYLSSDLMEPPDAEAHYTERLVRLPRLGTHYAPDEARPAAVDHASLGLDPGLPVFWSGQTQPKYLPRYDWIFPRIAQAVGPCRFVFVSTVNHALTRMFEERLGRAFAACGLDAEQYCLILPKMPQDRFVGVVGLADVVLDPPGWSGGKSTLDCLAQNPAIVTWPGRFMRGRHTAAILRRIGCEATIAGSLEEYVDIAVRLAREVGWRAQVRQAVAEGKHLAFRDTDYVRALEQFLRDAVASG